MDIFDIQLNQLVQQKRTIELLQKCKYLPDSTRRSLLMGIVKIDADIDNLIEDKHKISV